MQRYSPFNGIPSGNCPYAPAVPVAPNPQIVGEGDVASLTLPDGSLQLYFVPAIVHCQPYPVAWFIRTIPNLFPAQPPAPNQQFETVSSKHSVPQFWTQEKPGHSLQFHNDKTTSSTDMHYFSKTNDMACCKACSCNNCQKADMKMSVDSAADESKNNKWNTNVFHCMCQNWQNVDKSMETTGKSVKKQRTSEKSVQSVRDQHSQAPRCDCPSDVVCDCP